MATNPKSSKAAATKKTPASKKTLTPASKQTPGTHQASTQCCVCEADIIDNQEDSIFCEGACNGWLHRRCTGLSRSVMENYGKSSKPFQCMNCRLELQCIVIEDKT